MAHSPSEDGEGGGEVAGAVLRPPTTRPGSARRRRRTVPATATVEQRDGQPVLVKRAHDPEGRAALAHEARMLTLARHPGVVELLSLTDDPAASTPPLLRLVSSHTLTSTACRSPEHAAGIVATLAETVADLHHLG